MVESKDNKECLTTDLHTAFCRNVTVLSSRPFFPSLIQRICVRNLSIPHCAGCAGRTKVLFCHELVGSAAREQAWHTRKHTQQPSPSGRASWLLGSRDEPVVCVLWGAVGLELEGYTLAMASTLLILAGSEARAQRVIYQKSNN